MPTMTGSAPNCEGCLRGTHLSAAAQLCTPTVCSALLPPPHMQVEASAYASAGLQSALDDYRRACYEAGAEVRKQLRELASRLQVG